MIQVLVSIGSNIEREYHISAAIGALNELAENCRFSRVFEAKPVGFDGPNFYNLVAEFYTDLSLDALMVALRDIESRFGREPNAIKCRSRTLDIDLLTYGDRCQAGNPTLPREDIYIFAFTLWPLAELCPLQRIPGDTKTFREAWMAFEEEQSLWPATDFIFSSNTKSCR